MKQDCLDIGTIQAFLDGEVLPESSAAISGHIADCDACAQLLAVAEDENVFVFGTLDREMNSLVPTQRLWSRINESIGAGRDSISLWERAASFLSVQLLSPSLSAAAGVILLVAVVVGIWSLDPGNADKDLTAKSDAVQQNVASGPAPIGSGDLVVNDLPSADDSASVAASEPAQDSIPAVSGPVTVADRHVPRRTSQSPPPDNAVRPMTLQYIPGEESYLKTIDELKASVDVQKDHVLPPTSRVAFERDLAVVDDAITRMQEVVRREPQNQAARQVLYSAYQDKIDLLNSVGQRGELMASLR